MIRDARPADRAAILAINRAGQPGATSLSPAEVDRLPRARALEAEILADALDERVVHAAAAREARVV